MISRKELTTAFIGILIVIAGYFLVNSSVGTHDTSGVLSDNKINAVKKGTLPTRDEFLDAVNKERAKKNIAPLEIDERLNMSAQYKANDMHTRNYFSHDDPTTGKQGYEFINKTSLKCNVVGENFTGTDDKSLNTLQASMDSWINSKAHYAAMVDPKYTLTGFGIEHNVVVQHFCEQQ